MTETAATPMVTALPFDEIFVENTYNECSKVEIRRLARQIRALGLSDPLVVYRNGENRFVLVSGVRRYMAIQLLKEDYPTEFQEVPVTVVGAEHVERLREIESVRNAS